LDHRTPYSWEPDRTMLVAHVALVVAAQHGFAFGFGANAMALDRAGTTAAASQTRGSKGRSFLRHHVSSSLNRWKIGYPNASISNKLNSGSVASVGVRKERTNSAFVRHLRGSSPRRYPE